MPSIPAIASSRCEPSVKAEGSLKFTPSAGVPVGAGDGVAGAFDVVFDTGAGAAGAVCVCSVEDVGVDGAFEEDDEAAGTALGFAKVKMSPYANNVRWSTLDVMHTMNPFSSILYDSTVFASCKILPDDSAQYQHTTAQIRKLGLYFVVSTGTYQNI